MRSPEPNREVFRLAPPLILWWVWVAFAVANVADFAIQGASARFAIVVSAILVTVTGLACVLALRPRVIAEPSGLTIVNPFRDHHVPWAAITAVDTGDWVRVHYTPGQTAPGAASPPGSTASSAASRTISCWALYISARTKRRAARARPLAPAGLPGFARAARRPRGTQTLSGMLAAANQEPGYARLSGEARYLASLPAAKAIAVRLDTRASRERTRPGPANPGQANPGQAAPGPANTEHPVTARWAWPAVAAVAVPALALLVVVLA
ncbi:MAG: PH domain-containing protein [Streptosporangiaceae bacterium]